MGHFANYECRSLRILIQGNTVMEESNSEDTYKCQLPPMTSEERRMSNISDWAPSVVSSVDIQVVNIVHSCN